MNPEYIMLFFFAVFISSFSQILLKISANKNHASLKKEYLNPLVIIAYAIFFISIILVIISYRGISLKMGPIIDSSSYIFVFLLSHIFLKEKINRRTIIGIVLIVTGIIIFNF